MPVVSVVMSVFNAKNKHIVDQAVQSILLQTFTDLEFIICDDGSVNGCIDYIRRTAANDQRVKMIANNTNRGLAYSLNRCLANACGKYIARMDIDDISYTDRLEKQVDFLERHKEYSFVGSSVALFSDDTDWGTRIMKEKPLAKDFLFAQPFCHGSTMFRKDVLDMAGGYRVQWDTVRAEDYELFMRLYAKGFRGYNIQETLYKVREDKDAYKRRSYRHRLEEAHVRMVGFQRLGLYPVAVPYVIKPLLVGLIPQQILRKMRREEHPNTYK